MTIVESDWMDWGDESRHTPFTSSSCLEGPKLGGGGGEGVLSPQSIQSEHLH